MKFQQIHRLFTQKKKIYNTKADERLVTGFLIPLSALHTSPPPLVGEPIPVEKNPNPTKEEVAEVHQKYKDALVKLFEENKLKYGVEADRRLSII